jgi:hypothetical protein
MKAAADESGEQFDSKRYQFKLPPSQKRATQNLSTSKYEPNLGGILLTNDGDATSTIKCQIANHTPEHVNRRYQRNLNNFELIETNFFIVNDGNKMGQNLRGMYQDWQAERSKCISDKNRFVSLKTRGSDILYDAVLKPSHYVFDPTKDHIQLLNYTEAGGYFYYCAHVHNDSNLMSLLNYHIENDSNARMENASANVQKYTWQVAAFCRSTVKGSQGKKSIEQFSIDSFVVAIDPSDEVTKKHSYEKESALPLVVLRVWSDYTMKDTFCDVRLLQILQYFHYRKRGTNSMIAMVPSNLNQLITYMAHVMNYDEDGEPEELSSGIDDKKEKDYEQNLSRYPCS